MQDGFNVDDIDKLTQKLLDVAKKTEPKQLKKFIKSEGNKLKRKTVSKAKKTVKKKKGNYLKGIKTGKVYKYKGDELAVRVYNSMPHAHLIEYGYEHRDHKKRNKRPTGKFVQGKRIFESTRKEFQNQFIKDIEDFVVEKLKL
ncbi:hypothetical protein J2Z35_001197 [Acetoanaerobium pronyense]|uniref:HK97 gp10 family phage protein n=1 Tax=Acetoanaerobium pronyense TaxID=1482736 RepID=A0ABS4KHZ8_9FIRM|nr:HK97 gp10 family phage protein [Acetoanaerobium pronyense]MBP2027403.1 hypothetical protein [Acetoanaerobium pronyense]